MDPGSFRHPKHTLRPLGSNHAESENCRPAGEGPLRFGPVTSSATSMFRQRLAYIPTEISVHTGCGRLCCSVRSKGCKRRACTHADSTNYLQSVCTLFGLIFTHSIRSWMYFSHFLPLTALSSRARYVAKACDTTSCWSRLNHALKRLAGASSDATQHLCRNISGSFRIYRTRSELSNPNCSRQHHKTRRFHSPPGLLRMRRYETAEASLRVLPCQERTRSNS